MNKIKLAIITVLGTTLMSSAALANFYMGGEAQYDMFKYDNTLNKLTFAGTNPISKKSVAGGGFFLGSRFNENLGLEAGLSTSGSVKGSWNENKTINGVRANNSGNIKMTTSNAYADLMGYLPVGCDIDLIGSVGLGLLFSKIDANQNVSGANRGLSLSVQQNVNGTHAKAGVRAGVGAQYKFDENIGARLMVRYQQGNEFVKNNTQVGLGMFYQF